MEELIPVNVVVGDRNYRIRIEPKDEEVVRKTLKVINDRLVDFKTNFAGKDMQDYIAMVLLWFATQQKSATASTVLHSGIQQQLDDLEKMVDGRMNK
jgi:cell division protein ZapA